MAIINGDQKSYDALMKAYESAVADNVEKFIFEGDEIVTGYAKYLLQYLKTLL
jgi:hypothetical protein